MHYFGLRQIRFGDLDKEGKNTTYLPGTHKVTGGKGQYLRRFFTSLSEQTLQFFRRGFLISWSITGITSIAGREGVSMWRSPPLLWFLSSRRWKRSLITCCIPCALPCNSLLSYGAYGVNMPLDYHPRHVCMLERGWVLAFAHVRGGGERGKAWHAAGRGLSKWNSFHDFEVQCRPMITLDMCIVETDHTNARGSIYGPAVKFPLSHEITWRTRCL